MKRAFFLLLLALLAPALSGCGVKGKLKSPAQIKLEESKKAKKNRSSGDSSAQSRVEYAVSAS